MFVYIFHFFIIAIFISYFSFSAKAQSDLENKGAIKCNSIIGKSQIINNKSSRFLGDTLPYLGWEAHYGASECVIFNNDGTILVSCGDDGTLRLWDVQSGVFLRTIPAHSSNILSVCFSPDGTKIASAGRDYKAKLWDTKTGKLIRVISEEKGTIYSVAFSPDGKTIATGGSEEKIKLWNVENGTFKKEYPGHAIQVNSIAFSSDGQKIASCGESDNKINMWDLKADTLLISIKTSSFPSWIVFLPDGKRFITGCQRSLLSNQSIILWDAVDGSIVKIFSGYTFGITGTFTLSPDGTQIAVACDDFNIRIIEIATGSVVKTFYEHKYWIFSLAFSPDGEKLASTSGDNTIKLWDVKTTTELKTFIGHTGAVNQFIFSPDGKKIASGAYFAQIKIWNAQDGSLITNVKKPEVGFRNPAPVFSLTFSPDGTKLASAGWDLIQSVDIWDVNTGNLIKAINDSLDFASGLVFSPDGTKIAAGGLTAETIKIWDVNSGKLLKKWKSYQWTWSIAYSPDGNMLASGQFDPLGERSVKLWDANTGNLLLRLYGHTDIINSVAFSPNGTLLASGSLDSTIIIWDIQKGTSKYILKGHTNYIRSVCFSPDGKTIASGSHDGTIKIWDVNSGTLNRTIILDHGEPVSISYSPDGSKIASDGWGYNNMRIYDLKTNSVEMNELRNTDLKLYQNYPNPFNPSTIIQYSLNEKSHVSLKIYNSLGQEIDTLIAKEQPGGEYIVEWKPKNISNGLYFYRLQAGSYVETKKIVYLK